MYISKHILYSLALSALKIVTAQSEGQDWEWDYVEDGIVEDLTFGAHGSIWAKDHRHIAGWSLSGEGYQPELMSDRIILTPPYPGNKRGAVWADHPETHDEWEAEFEFRAAGPERGSGNIQFWFAKEPKHEIQSKSLYTVGKFDGLVLSIGQYNGHGTLRAFLNDGSVSFKDHHHVDQLSFASCDFNYRNLGRFSHILVKQTQYTFEVEIDHSSCIQTHKIHLPHGYYFGLTAASAENPDSFETRSFVVHKLKEGKKIYSPGHGKHPDQTHQSDHQQHHNNDHDHWVQEVQDHYQHHGEPEQTPYHEASDHADSAHTPAHDPQYDYHQDNRGWYWTTEKESAPHDAPASSFKTEVERFEDLHTRISTINHQLDILFHDLTTFKKESEERHQTILVNVITQTEHNRRLLEQLVRDIEGKDYRETLERIHASVMQGHEAVMLTVPHAVGDMVKSHSPRFGFFLFLIIGTQVMLLGSYIIYKRRLKSQPKKYL